MAKVGKNLRRVLSQNIEVGQQREIHEALGSQDEHGVSPIDMTGIYHTVMWGNPDLPAQLWSYLAPLYPKSKAAVTVSVHLQNEYGMQMMRRTFAAPGAIMAPWQGRTLAGSPFPLVLTPADLQRLEPSVASRYPEAWQVILAMGQAGTIKAEVASRWEEIHSAVHHYISEASTDREAVTLWPAIGLLTRGSHKINPVAPYKRGTVEPTRNAELWHAAIGGDRPGIRSPIQTQDEMTAKLVTYLALTA